MVNEDVLLSNRLRLKAFTGLELEVGEAIDNNGLITNISSHVLVTTYLRVSDYALGLALNRVILPVGSKIIFGLDNQVAGWSNFTNMYNNIGYDLTDITDEYYYTCRVTSFGLNRFVKGYVIDSDFERLAKACINIIFTGYTGYVNATAIKCKLSNYVYLAEPYLSGYDTDWLRRFVPVLDFNQELKSQLKGVLSYGGTDFEFLKWLHSVLIHWSTYYFINNLVTYSLFISDSRLYMIEQLRQFLVNYYRG